MGGFSFLGSMVVLTGWFALIEFDQYPEAEREKILQRVRKSPLAIITIALMPLGIIINFIGTLLGSLIMVVIAAIMIFVQSIVVALLFWKRKRWKSIVLLTTFLIMAVFIFLPLFWI